MTIHRIWYIDTGRLPSQKALKHVQKVKEEVEKEKTKAEKKLYRDYYFGTTGQGGSRIEIIETA